MSAAARLAIAAAASTAEGIVCDPHFMQTAEPGAAMVRLDRIEYPDKFGGVGYWNVIVLMPQDMASAEVFLDDNLDALREAIAPELAITSVQPQRFDLPGVGVLLCVSINGHREEE